MHLHTANKNQDVILSHPGFKTAAYNRTFLSDKKQDHY